MKLYTNRYDHLLYQMCAIVREITQANDIVTEVVPQAVQDSDAFKAKRGGHGKFPMLELADGSMIYESNAIAQYIARRSAHAGALCGFNAFEEAQIESWQNYNAQSAGPAIAIFYQTVGGLTNEAAYNDAVKAFKERAKKMNDHLAGKTFLVGQRLTLADISNFIFMSVGFAFVFDGGFRKAMVNVTEWFQRVAAQSAVINHHGCARMCDKAMKPVDVSKLPKVEDLPKAAPAAPAKQEKKDDDDFDPFADDDEEDEEAEAAKVARMKAIAEKAGKLNKPKAIAKSIVVWEVKPWGEETDLDEMAKLILGIEQDGLQWKTEYKKEPIAYGVYKIVIGATIEDEKVSTDDIQEKIEAFEDHVQSVDIQSFNKL